MSGTIIFHDLQSLVDFLALWASTQSTAGFDVIKSNSSRWELTFNGSN